MRKLLINLLFCYCLCMFVSYNAYQEKVLQSLDGEHKQLDDYIPYLGLDYKIVPAHFILEDPEDNEDQNKFLYDNEVVELSGLPGSCYFRYRLGNEEELKDDTVNKISLLRWSPREKNIDTFYMLLNELVNLYGNYNSDDSFPLLEENGYYLGSYIWDEIDRKRLSLTFLQDDDSDRLKLYVSWEYEKDMELDPIETIPLEDYKQYVGMDYRDLPERFYFDEYSKYTSDFIYDDEVVEFAGVRGSIYLTGNFDGGYERPNNPKNIIGILTWSPDKSNEKIYNKILDELINQYGEFTSLNLHTSFGTYSYEWVDIEDKKLVFICDVLKNGKYSDIYVYWIYSPDPSEE